MIVDNGHIELFTYQTAIGWMWRANDRQTGEWVARSVVGYETDNQACCEGKKSCQSERLLLLPC